MTFQLLHFEFPYIWENLIFFFNSVLFNNLYCLFLCTLINSTTQYSFAADWFWDGIPEYSEIALPVWVPDRYRLHLINISPHIIHIKLHRIYANHSIAVPEFIDPVFTKTSPKRSFSLNRKRAFWLVFAKTGSIISGTGLDCRTVQLVFCYVTRA